MQDRSNIFAFFRCRTQISYPLPREAYSSADPAAQSTARWTTFEDVVLGLEEAEKSVMMLTDQNHVLIEKQSLRKKYGGLNEMSS
ncbi:hypothetical protein CDAR_250741 [Caerostris darwini]|uniref:Uncharacterized protein n=1 Tax=Caerostris darwini TaxID=1538125 RepID=A0AAV4SZ59_9ARAC|nr:hypothetical protein CDAR_250741 [Caerostris darwini]